MCSKNAVSLPDPIETQLLDVGYNDGELILHFASQGIVTLVPWVKDIGASTGHNRRERAAHQAPEAGQVRCRYTWGELWIMILNRPFGHRHHLLSRLLPSTIRRQASFVSSEKPFLENVQSFVAVQLE